MTSQYVHLFSLGYSGDLDLRAVAKLINGCQQVISVDLLDTRHSIGKPDVNDLAYSRETLFHAFPKRIPGHVHVGVTVAPIDGNFYTVTQGTDSVVITLHQTQEVSEQAGRTKEEYVAQTLVTELLWLQYRRATGIDDFEQLYHLQTQACIFDLVLQKTDKVYKLRSGHICTSCAAKLAHANVGASYQAAVTSVLARVQKPSLVRSLTLGLQRPLFSFVLGTLLGGLVINLFSTLLIGQARDVIVPFAVLLVLTVGLVGWNYLRLRRPATPG
ncbi:hypothetical protein [Jatrophihabitans sp.]|uniref:hypothetical protein n=1 Tax=Jatrophihabitans sp. TaxID=1932789 RepID=UPI002C1C9AA6|nr:hypothetical protein [Jatrophihabitans sp.]